jgi:DNA-binding IclR family transcriptional regulator
MTIPLRSPRPERYTRAIDWERGGAARGRGLELLTVLFDARCSLEVGAVARAMGTTRGAAYRLLRQLETMAFVARDGGGWRLPAGGAMTLPPALVGRLSLRAAARPVLERIATRTGETVCLNVRSREHRMRLDVVGERDAALTLGETLPMHVGASGKAILAFLPRAAAAPILAAAARGGEDELFLRARLHQVRRCGYLAAVGDRVPGAGALAVPIFGSSGVTGAVTVAGPAGRWGPDAMERAAGPVRIECAGLSAALGSLTVAD